MKCYLKDYPRPQFVRATWENLNGIWDFSFDDSNVGEKEKWYQDFKGELKIRVPFTYETKLSGIQDETCHKNIWYHKVIQVDGSKLENNNYILHFEGSDFVTKLWVNGQYVGSHRGGYTRFSFDISNLVQDGENELTVKVEDSLDNHQPRGKQRWIEQNFSCWYMPISGIWKTVWSEYVPKISLSNVKMTPDLQKGSLELEADINIPEEQYNAGLMLDITVTLRDEFINRTCLSISSSHITTSISVKRTECSGVRHDVEVWRPGRPSLYDLNFKIVDNQTIVDEVGSYFAMRDIRIEGSHVLLNGYPLYQRLILDQGYWEDSAYTPPSEEALIEDIEKIQAMGYNGLRKHQKTEDERFLYWCDVKGMLVWGETPSAYRFSDYAVEEFTTEWIKIVKQNYNHPCIITWTAFNESWGITQIKNNPDQQHFTESIYHLTKSIDRYRPVLVNDGWEHTVSDIITLHDYEEFGERLKMRYMDKDAILHSDGYPNVRFAAFANGYEYKGQPVILSEYGGIAFNNDNSGVAYGRRAETKEEFVARLDSLTSAIKEIPYISGYCFTQVSDVAQENSGLLDAKRNYKIEPEIIREINDRGMEIYESNMNISGKKQITH